jgi:hypothetical protein
MGVGTGISGVGISPFGAVGPFAVGEGHATGVWGLGPVVVVGVWAGLNHLNLGFLLSEKRI